ncbi:hypothetical protein D3C87_1615530 [compost metagenome]
MRNGIGTQVAARRQRHGQGVGQSKPGAALRFRHQRVREARVLASLPGGVDGQALFGGAHQRGCAGLGEQAFGGVAKQGVHGGHPVVIEGLGRAR